MNIFNNTFAEVVLATKHTSMDWIDYVKSSACRLSSDEDAADEEEEEEVDDEGVSVIMDSRTL